MGEFWAWEYTGTPFTLFGPSHIAAIAVVLLANISLFFWKNPSEQAKKRFRYILAAVLIIDEAILHIWRLSHGDWTIYNMLPFHLCAVLVYASAIMLVTKSKTIYDVVYFLGIAGALQAVAAASDIRKLPPSMKLPSASTS